MSLQHGWLVGQMSGPSLPGTSVNILLGTVCVLEGCDRSQHDVVPLDVRFFAVRWTITSLNCWVNCASCRQRLHPYFEGRVDRHVTSRFAHKDLHIYIYIYIVDYLTCRDFLYSSLYIAHDQTCISKHDTEGRDFTTGKNTYIISVNFFLRWLFTFYHKSPFGEYVSNHLEQI